MGLIYTGTGPPASVFRGRPGKRGGGRDGGPSRPPAPPQPRLWAGEGTRRRAPLSAVLSAWQGQRRNLEKSPSSAPPAPKGGRKEKLCSAFQLQGENKNPVGVTLVHSEQFVRRAAATKAWPRGDPGPSTHPQPHGSYLTSDLSGSTETDEEVDAEMADPRPADLGWSESGSPRGALAPGPRDCARGPVGTGSNHASPFFRIAVTSILVRVGQAWGNFLAERLTF